MEAVSCVAPLFVPGDRPDRFAKAAASGADGVIIDLEDAVADNRKEAARDALGQIPETDIPVFVRINGRRSPWHEKDLKAVAGLPLAGIFLPKAEAAEDVEALADATGHPALAMIETALGLSRARLIAAAQGAVRLAFGFFDYAADVGCAPSRMALLIPRSEIVLASRLAGLSPPLEGVTMALDDPARTEEDAHHAAELGFGGKLVIHPKQVAPVVAGFAPSEAETRWAEMILEAPEGGAGRVGGSFVDAPVIRRVEAIMARAKKQRGTA